MADADSTTHSFRVTTITDLLEQGVPLEDVQRLAGHADPCTIRPLRSARQEDHAECRGADFDLVLTYIGVCRAYAVTRMMSERATPSGHSVVILEDDPLVAGTLSTLLTESGAHVRTISTVDELIELRGRGTNAPGLYVVDINLGVGRRSEGIDAIRTIRSQLDDRDAFIAVYSGEAARYADKARLAGADIVLSKGPRKPIQDDVNTIITEWLTRRPDRQQQVTAAPDTEEPTEALLGSDLSVSGLIGPDGRPLSTDTPTGIVVVNAVTTANDRLREILERDPRLLWTISPRRFEELVADILTNLGWSVTLTPPTKDGGIDMMAAKKDALGDFLCLVECKRYVPPNKVALPPWTFTSPVYWRRQEQQQQCWLLHPTSQKVRKNISRI